ncbi:hypothetical protein [Streptomyces antarcticus]|nr:MULTISPECIES: hypothetical protein [unclassified Streptomyces]MCY0943560.1 hypothetical protein [Streptomyces sp. H34-AA3]MCZ4083531.1 hypothetical protein [Streptomyces sp. H34-S5]
MDLAMPAHPSAPPPHRPGDSDPDANEALRRVRATPTGGAR